MKDYRQILEVPADATPEQIKAQYKRLVRIYHPDRFTSEQDKQYVEAKLKEITDEYPILITLFTVKMSSDKAAKQNPRMKVGGKRKPKKTQRNGYQRRQNIRNAPNPTLYYSGRREAPWETGFNQANVGLKTRLLTYGAVLTWTA